MELNERQWRAGMNFRVDVVETDIASFETSLAAAQTRRRELTLDGAHVVVSRLTEAGEAIPLHG